MQPVPEVKENEVKIRVRYGGICGSDLRVYKGQIIYAQYPLRPGHEVVGTVIEAGVNATQKVGTKVAVFPNTYCGECEFCIGGKTNICKYKKPLGVSTDGVFAQEVVIDAKYAVPIPDGMPDKRAVLVEPFAVTVHALKKAEIGKGISVAVVGCGTEGLLAVALSLNMGAEVTVIDVNPVKLDIARSFGPMQTMQPQEVGKDTMFDVVIEAAGVKTAIEQAVQMVKPGGSMIALGITSEAVNWVPIHVVRNEISIFGTIIYTQQDFEDAIRYLNDPTFNVDPVISKIVPFTDFQSAFDDALSGNYAKIVLDFK
ncbi:zinc-dependent alcohol dehydrogenase [Sporomusa sp.]|uniref:zinc-dependent alcohol dehydrogenase n=1 Tax=Sporomusa sp. TaxID=2078658 RepID=UPI002C5BD978|nr:alcohol dehydrogenase catalytic domain-containing protein [Sporomusa sp.]HWR44528.1 alcohol dehydrogenase catalytic domain-containing protein [Sporomusa sp.]